MARRINITCGRILFCVFQLLDSEHLAIGLVLSGLPPSPLLTGLTHTPSLPVLFTVKFGLSPPLPLMTLPEQ